QPLAYHHASRIHDIVNELARRAGLKETPKLYYLPQKQVNAFAFGHSREAGIALSQGLLNHLTLDEVSGVLAHEMSHIKHKDLSVMTLATTISNMTRMMANVGFFLLLINLPRVLLGMFPISWSAIFLLIFAPALAGMVQLALSRVREFRADLGAAQLLGTPQPLVSALTKMDRLNRGMFGLFAPSMRMSAPSLFSTHPPTPERIRRLRSVADQPAFEAPIRIVIPEVSHPQAVWM
ncbi:MAG: zinc metalloprotease HtpX, partial [Chloroflexota bacterium]